MTITLLIADASVLMPSDALSVVSAIGSLGFAIWFAYHTTTVTLPRQQQENRELLKELAETHAATIKELVSEIRANRESYDRWRSCGSNH